LHEIEAACFNAGWMPAAPKAVKLAQTPQRSLVNQLFAFFEGIAIIRGFAQFLSIRWHPLYFATANDRAPHPIF